MQLRYIYKSAMMMPTKEDQHVWALAAKAIRVAPEIRRLAGTDVIVTLWHKLRCANRSVLWYAWAMW